MGDDRLGRCEKGDEDDCRHSLEPYSAETVAGWLLNDGMSEILASTTNVIS